MRQATRVEPELRTKDRPEEESRMRGPHPVKTCTVRWSRNEIRRTAKAYGDWSRVWFTSQNYGKIEWDSLSTIPQI